jgi:FdhD protein
MRSLELTADSSVQSAVTRLSSNAAPVTNEDSLAVEEPLEIRVRGEAIVVTMRTPGHDEELAAGFLLTEGILKRRSDITEIAHCRSAPESALTGNILNVFLAPDVTLDLARLTRHVFSASSCGLCGKASIETVHQQFAPVEKPLEIPLPILLTLPPKLRSAQKTFDTTGGLHAAALFTATGELLIAREDIGRHNAVDKVLGRAFFENLLPLGNHILMASGRASFEIMQKALVAGIRCVAAVSAPSSLAVEFARESNQALYGFVRETSANRYA